MVQEVRGVVQRSLPACEGEKFEASLSEDCRAVRDALVFVALGPRSASAHILFEVLVFILHQLGGFADVLLVRFVNVLNYRFLGSLFLRLEVLLRNKLEDLINEDRVQDSLSRTGIDDPDVRLLLDLLRCKA